MLEHSRTGGESFYLIVGFWSQVATPKPTVLGGIVLVILLVVAIVVAWRHWEEAHEEVTSDTPAEILASFEEAHAAGEIDDAEFARVRAQFGPLASSKKSTKPIPPKSS